MLFKGDTFMICEDGWNDEGLDYGTNPFQRLADAAPDLVVSINASPSNIGKREQRHGAHFLVGGERRIGEKIIKPLVHPCQPEMEQAIETWFTPTHSHPFEPLLNEPLAGTFGQATANG